jgi:hypothetical protein
VACSPARGVRTAGARRGREPVEWALSRALHIPPGRAACWSWDSDFRRPTRHSSPPRRATALTAGCQRPCPAAGRWRGRSVSCCGRPASVVLAFDAKRSSTRTQTDSPCSCHTHHHCCCPRKQFKTTTTNFAPQRPPRDPRPQPRAPEVPQRQPPIRAARQPRAPPEKAQRRVPGSK